METASPSPALTIYGKPISVVPFFKNLGIEIALGPNRWTPFFQRNLKSAQQSAHYITSMAKMGIPIDPRTLKTLLQSLVFSVLEYGMQVWGPFCSPSVYYERDAFRLHALRTAVGLDKYWPNIPRGRRRYPCTSVLLRLDWGISPTAHRIAELTFRFWNRCLLLNRSATHAKLFRQWALHFRTSRTPHPDDWFASARSVFADYNLLSYFDELRPIPYGVLCVAFVSYWSLHEEILIDEMPNMQRLSHYKTIIASYKRRAENYITALSDDRRRSYNPSGRVITIYKMGLAKYLSLWRAPGHGPNAIRIISVIRSGYGPQTCIDCGAQLLPQDVLHHLLVSCTSPALGALLRSLAADIDSCVPQIVIAHLHRTNAIETRDFLLMHFEGDTFLMSLDAKEIRKTHLWPLLRCLSTFLRAIYVKHFLDIPATP